MDATSWLVIACVVAGNAFLIACVSFLGRFRLMDLRLQSLHRENNRLIGKMDTLASRVCKIENIGVFDGGDQMKTLRDYINSHQPLPTTVQDLFDRELEKLRSQPKANGTVS